MEDKKQTYFEKYDKTTHLLGRVVSIITLALLLGAPFAIGRWQKKSLKNKISSCISSVFLI